MTVGGRDEGSPPVSPDNDGNDNNDYGHHPANGNDNGNYDNGRWTQRRRSIASPDDNGNDDGHHPADGDDDGDDIDERQTQRRQSTHLPNTPTSTGKIKQKSHQ